MFGWKRLVQYLSLYGREIEHSSLLIHSIFITTGALMTIKTETETSRVYDWGKWLRRRPFPRPFKVLVRYFLSLLEGILTSKCFNSTFFFWMTSTLLQHFTPYLQIGCLLFLLLVTSEGKTREIRVKFWYTILCLSPLYPFFFSLYLSLFFFLTSLDPFAPFSSFKTSIFIEKH